MLTPSEIYQTLLAAYGWPRWWSEDPYRVMFQAVLVQNTAWANVERPAPLWGSGSPRRRWPASPPWSWRR